MIGNLKGKVALVTGGGQGIGAEIARRFAQAGANVSIATRTVEKGQAVAQDIAASGGQCCALKVDVGHRVEVVSAVDHTVERYGHLDIVVHNAAVYRYRLIENLAEEELEHSLAVNLKAGFWLIQAALPHLRKRGGGRILFTSSVTGPKVAMPGTSPYAAAKSGMNGLIRTAALEFARERITVNGVEPGFIVTPASAGFGTQQQLDEMAQSIPLGALGAPADIANAMLFLASDEARYVTGQTLVVDGGSTLPENAAIVNAYYRKAAELRGTVPTFDEPDWIE
jgi:3-oxoacyl-[acyl-carrier protein] reductase